MSTTRTGAFVAARTPTTIMRTTAVAATSHLKHLFNRQHAHFSFSLWVLRRYRGTKVANSSTPEDYLPMNTSAPDESKRV
jgi:hypothetical protein